MKSHGLDMIGNLHLEDVTSLPTWSASDERRLVYESTNQILYYGGNSGWDRFIQNHHHLYQLELKYGFMPIQLLQDGQ